MFRVTLSEVTFSRSILEHVPIIRLGWKGLSVTNTLAHYENSQITTIKSFVTLGLGQHN
jgi:hypothetical protein